MKTHTKTAEQIKAYIDSMDLKVQELGKDINNFMEKSKITYQQEMQNLKKQTEHAKDEAREKYHQKVQEVKETYEEFLSESKSLIENNLELTKSKIKTLKQDVTRSTHDAGEKLDQVQDEAEELLETTKLAFHNFKETFKKKE